MRGIWSREHEQRYCLEYQSMPEDANRSLPTARLENSILDTIMYVGMLNFYFSQEFAKY